MNKYLRKASLGVFLSVVLLSVPGTGDIQAADPSSKVDPYLKLLLRGSPALRAQGLQEDGRVEVIVSGREDVTPALLGLGAEVRTALAGGTLVTALLPTASVRPLAARPEVTFVDGSKPLHRMVNAVPVENEIDASPPPLGTSTEEMGATKVWALTDAAGVPLKGRGVIVGVVDSGIDWKHGDFKGASGSSRILSLWDQSVSGTGPSGTTYRYGMECTQAQINAGSCGLKDTDGHGTHVASIAAGSGLSSNPPKHIGVAPEADLVVVSLGKGGTARKIDAWKYVIDKAVALGRPVVINNSWGHNLGAKDGSDPLEQAIDLLAGPGKIFVNAVGNAGGALTHAQGTVAQGGSTTVAFGFPEPSPFEYSALTVWYRGADSLAVSIRTPAGQTFGPVKKGGEATFTASDGTKIVIDATLAPYAANKDNAILIVLDRDTKVMSGNWSFTLNGEAVTAGGRFDSWLALVNAGGTEVFTSNASFDVSLGEPSTARRTVSVAGYVTKRCIDSVTRGTICNRSLTGTGIIDPDSSRGPTRDGRQKPDISAPGTFITAALSADAPMARSTSSEFFLVDPSRKHIALAGTSAAAPHITGVIALMLQKKPSMTPEEVKTALLESARSDSFTGAVWNASWGRGKVDALTAVTKVRPGIATPPELATPADGVLLPALSTTLSWTKPLGVTQYHIQVIPANNDGPGLNLIRGPESSFAVQAPAEGQGPYVMLPGMSYAWRVRVADAPMALGENDPAWGPWSASRRFRTPVRDTARLSPVTPPEGATVGPGAQLLTWGNGDKDVFYYEVQMSPDPNFELDPSRATAAVWTNLVHGGVSTPSNSWRTPELQPQSTYYWRIRPRVQGDGAPVAWGRAWSFRTQ